MKNYFKQSYNTLKEIKNQLYLVIAIFFIFVLLGLIFPNFFSEQINNLMKELTEKASTLNGLGLIKFIFFNNLQASFTSFILGMVYSIFPIVIAAFNGYILGVVSNTVIAHVGILELWKLLPHGIFELPAIFISFALGISIGLTFFKNKNIWISLISFIIFLYMFSILIFKISNLDPNTNSVLAILVLLTSYFFSLLIYFKTMSKKQRLLFIKTIKTKLKNYFIVFIFIVIPLLIIAALIEGTLIALFK